MSIESAIRQLGRDIDASLLTVQAMKRVAALVIDVFLCLAMAFFPVIGWIVALFYFCMRDALPIGARRSFGKSVYHLRIVDTQQDERRLTWRIYVLRNVILFIPILNIVDIFKYITTGRRLADEWLGTEVVATED